MSQQERCPENPWRLLIWSAIVVVFVCAIGLIGHDFTPNKPTPEEARAAMAEAGVCTPDAPIIEHDGTVTIGDYPLVLGGRSFIHPGDSHAVSPGRSPAIYGNFYFEPFITSWLPGGRWRVTNQRQ